MVCRTNGVSDRWCVGPMVCRTNGVSDQWCVGPMTVRRLPSSEVPILTAQCMCDMSHIVIHAGSASFYIGSCPKDILHFVQLVSYPIKHDTLNQCYPNAAHRLPR